jgi:UDP-N-acetylglucosamine:LPS N-acetylglucosamine transferase
MKICLECAEGGHLDEMLCIMDAFKGHEYFFVTTKAPTTEKLAEIYNVYYVRRQYNTQSKWAIYLRELILMNILFIYSFYILIQEHPNVIISTGGGATIPLCYVGKLLRKKIIYIESMARINKPSVTGRILYPISDIFLVQWEGMLKFYKRAQYWGKVI